MSGPTPHLPSWQLHIGEDYIDIEAGDEVILDDTPWNVNSRKHILYARMMAAAADLLNSALLDNMFPIITEKDWDEAETFAMLLGWKHDMPLDHFARQYRTEAIAKATEAPVKAGAA